MKIAFFAPRETARPSWMFRIPPELEKLGHQVLINEIDSNCNIAIIYSWSREGLFESMRGRNPNIPYICYFWDWFDHVDKVSYRTYLEKAKKAVENWAPSEDVISRITKAVPELKEKILKIPGYIESEEWQPPFEDKGYALMASYRRFYKRFEFFEKGCEELKIPYISCHPGKFNRNEYVEKVKNCKLMVSCSLAEGFGITPAEGAICEKPLLLTDIPVFREHWKDGAIYFEKDDFDDFKTKLKKMWEGKLKPNIEEAVNIVKNNFFPDKVTLKINERLKKYAPK